MMSRVQLVRQLPRIPQPFSAGARLPHPSWRAIGESAEPKEALSASDFWKRLGI